MIGLRWSRIGRVVFLSILGMTSASAQDSSLSIADLEAYRIALKSKAPATARVVRFQDLWDHPEEYRDRPVQVEGRVARLFRQPAIGEFPALVEVWIVSKAGDPFCLVFPDLEGKSLPDSGLRVRFSGTFLKRLRYPGKDVPRLAPLIVGPEAPRATDSTDTSVMDLSWSAIDWMMGLGAALVVGLVLARRHLSEPPTIPRAIDPAPQFVDRDPEVWPSGERES